MKFFSFSQNWWQFLIVAIVCYLMGCFNFASVIARFKKRDITKIGSGNPGTMNMSREFGWKVGLLTFLGDAFKSFLPIFITFLIYKDYYFEATAVKVGDFTRYFCLVFVIIGHIFPVTNHFKGGKGIATALGGFWTGLSIENPWWILFAFLLLCLLLGFIFITEYGSLGNLTMVSVFSVIQFVYFYTRYAATPVNAYLVCLYLFLFAINVLAWGAHYQNLIRLLAGEEHKTSMRKIIAKASKKNKE